MTGQARPPGVSARLSFRSEWEDVPEAGSGVFGKVLKATREYETHVCCHQNWLFWTFPTILDCFPAPRAVLKSSAFVIFNHGGGGYYLRHQSVRFRHRWRRLPHGAFFYLSRKFAAFSDSFLSRLRLETSLEEQKLSV